MELIAQPDSVKNFWNQELRKATAAPFIPGRIEGDPAAMQPPQFSSESN